LLAFHDFPAEHWDHLRTSVDHGTAFDIAWKGLANPQSLIEAIKLAVQMLH
ncbi:MAG TPA: hypothetical protein EYP09_11060, partial [Anaerolineae bacterium]|nr:hypothetical protein [Anaerolineae bacterium]